MYRRWRLIDLGKDDGKGGPHSDAGIYLGDAAGLGREAMDLGQSQSRSLADRFGRKERFENAGERFFRHASPGICDVDGYRNMAPMDGVPRFYEELPTPRHRVPGIYRSV